MRAQTWYPHVGGGAGAALCPACTHTQTLQRVKCSCILLESWHTELIASKRAAESFSVNVTVFGFELPSCSDQQCFSDQLS